MVVLKIWLGLCVALIVFAFTAQAEIHKWVDENGKIHYGDRPPVSGNTEQLEISVESYSTVEVRDMDKHDMAILEKEPKQQNQTKQVIMYSTESCGYCKKAKAYFNANKINFTERDINKSASAKRQWKKLNGTGVPLILIGERKMRGFSIEKFENIYSR